MTAPWRAGVEIGRRVGLDVGTPVVLQETNNTVLWLRPESVVAKIATRPDARSDLQLEHAIAVELRSMGAQIAAPLPGVGPMLHEPTGFLVTLWEHVAGNVGAEVPPVELATSLSELHDALGRTHVPVPSFRLALARARSALDDDGFMQALKRDDRDLLRRCYDEGLEHIDHLFVPERRLHGEPHAGNRLSTGTGIRWIDFESCCVGPLEWDLAFLPPELGHRYPEVDSALLDRLRVLNSARVATWCWGRAEIPEMRRHGHQHLALMRATLSGM